jgi:hypothetical protein
VKLRGLLLAIAAGVGAGWACGSGHGTPDAGSDGGGAIDGTPIDAQDRCQTLCSCTEEFCSDDFDACLVQCAGLDDSVLECRIEHCGYAQTNPGFHCPHALGDTTSPGFPPACGQP